MTGEYVEVSKTSGGWRTFGSREKARKPHSLLWGGMASGGLGAVAPHYGFFLGIFTGYIVRTSSRNKMKNFRFEALGLAPGRFT